MAVLLLGFSFASMPGAGQSDPDNDARCSGTACADAEWNRICATGCSYTADGDHWFETTGSHGSGDTLDGDGELNVNGGDEEDFCDFDPGFDNSCDTGHSFTTDNAVCQTATAFTRVEFALGTDDEVTDFEDVDC